MGGGVRYSLRSLVRVGGGGWLNQKAEEVNCTPGLLRSILHLTFQILYVNYTQAVHLLCAHVLQQLSVKPEHMFVQRMMVYASLCHRQTLPYGVLFFGRGLLR